jgi:hypothetical protein
MASVRFERWGKENGKTVYHALKKFSGRWYSFASISFDGEGWVLRHLPYGRVDRFATLREAKDEALKSAC